MLRIGLWLLARLIVPLRYRIRVHGWEHLGRLKSPVLLLPNHPGYIDPVLILAVFYPTLRPRLMLYEEIFRGPILHPLVTVFNAVSVPDLDRPSCEAHKQAEQALEEVIAGLRHGDNFTLWPSGRVQRDGVERLGGARALTEILQSVPDAEIVRVRTRGVWGSMFTYARTARGLLCFWRI